MFPNNILTFNPGWDENAHKLENFDDVRAIQRHLKNNNIKLGKQGRRKYFGASEFCGDGSGRECRFGRPTCITLE